MDGGGPDPVRWRSTIPGVSQREGAPASLAIVAWGGSAPIRGGSGGAGEAGVDARGADARGVDDSRAGRGPVPRRGPRLPWRAVAGAVLGLLAIVGVARVADVQGVRSGGGAGAGWASGPQRESEREPSASPAPPEGASSLAPGAEPDAGSPVLTAPPEPSASTGSGPPAARVSADILVAEPPDWSAVLAELDQRRSAALVGQDLDALASHALPGSPAWDADAALLADLQERGLRPRGLTSAVLAVEQVDRNGARATLQILDQRSAYELVDAQGAVVDRVELAAPTRWAVTLQQQPDGDRGWRFVDVIPVPEFPSASPAPREAEP